MSEKTKAELLADELKYAPAHAMKQIDESEVQAADDFCAGYMQFLNDCKTEREVTAFMQKAAEARGFVPFDRTKSYAPGDKVYFVNRGKAIILAVFGKKSVCEGVRIAAAHIDSPRLDLKPSPLYEDEELALFKTHYYGGIKKYQWTAIPLSLHGVVYLKDGSCATVSLGEKEGEPKFVITDLLPHLAREQEKRTLEDGIRGEELNVLVGSRPFCTDSGSEMVKLNILHLLHEKYGMTEKDFLSAFFLLVRLPVKPPPGFFFNSPFLRGGHRFRGSQGPKGYPFPISFLVIHVEEGPLSHIGTSAAVPIALPVIRLPAGAKVPGIPTISVDHLIPGFSLRISQGNLLPVHISIVFGIPDVFMLAVHFSVSPSIR